MLESLLAMIPVIDFSSLHENDVFLGLFSMYLLGVATWLLRNIPSRIISFIQRHSTIELLIDSSQYEDEALYKNFQIWYKESGHLRHSRTMRSSKVGGHRARNSIERLLNSNEDDAVDGINYSQTLEAGVGFHFFFHKWRPFWFYVSQEQLQSNVYFKIEIKTIGRSHQSIINLLKLTEPPKVENVIGIQRYTMSNGWQSKKKITKRPLETVAIDSAVKQKIIDSIETFNNDRDWLLSHGLPHKMTMIFSGPPGTGKTSLAKALASHYDRDLCVININSMGDDSFAEAISEAPHRAIILIEDFDSAGAIHKREENGTLTNKVEEKFTPLSLTGFLNTLDGVDAIDDKIIILTTNHLDSIDNAVIRSGRVDGIFEIGYLTDKEIREYIKVSFPEVTDEFLSGYQFPTQPGCNLNAGILACKKDYVKFVEFLANVEK